MKTPIDYLNDLKAKTGSDYATAKLLNTRQTTLSSIRERNAMSDDNAVKIADLLGIDRDELLIAAAIARSEGVVKTAWMNHAQRSGLASIALALTLTPSIFGDLVCILCQIALEAQFLHFFRLNNKKSQKHDTEKTRKAREIEFLPYAMA